MSARADRGGWVWPGDQVYAWVGLVFTLCVLVMLALVFTGIVCWHIDDRRKRVAAAQREREHFGAGEMLREVREQQARLARIEAERDWAAVVAFPAETPPPIRYQVTTVVQQPISRSRLLHVVHTPVEGL